MLIDALNMLRADGTSPRVTSTEAGATSVTRVAETGQAVIDVRKLGLKGVPIVVITDDDTSDCHSEDDGQTVTIEASDTVGFTASEVVATFPKVLAQANGTTMIRRVHTQKQYLRSVITTSSGTPSVDFLIFISNGQLAKD